MTTVSAETIMRTKPSFLEQSTGREFIGRAAAIAACAAHICYEGGQEEVRR
jgi:hypothetical protein